MKRPLSIRGVFVVCVAVLALLYILFFVLVRRLPMAHDTLSYIQYQYAFLNEIVSKGEFPYWFPHYSNGMPGNWYFPLSNALLNNVYYLLAPRLHGVNFYYLFYLSLFFDEMVLILGTVLLASLYYRKQSVLLFVVIAVVGSVNWATQVWYNFHIYYLSPLLMYFFVRGITQRSLVWFSLGVFGTFLTTYGNLQYMLPVVGFYQFLFICFFAALLYAAPFISSWFRKAPPHEGAGGPDGPGGSVPHRMLAALKDIARECRTQPGYLPGMFLAALTAAALFFFYVYAKNIGAKEMVFLGSRSSGRGYVDFDMFMNYGGLISASKYWELLTGVPGYVDQSLYVGFITIALFFLAIVYLHLGEFREGKEYVHVGTLLLLCAAMISFSGAGIVAVLSYHYWPGMKMYRHIGLVSSTIKLPIIFIAGFALERFLSDWEKRGAAGLKTPAKVFAAVAGLAFALRALLLALGDANARSLRLYSFAGWLPGYPLTIAALTPYLIGSLLLLAAFLLYVRVLRTAGPGRFAAAVVPVFLGLHAADMFSYRSSAYAPLFPPAQPQAVGDYAFYDHPYGPARHINHHWNDRFNNFYNNLTANNAPQYTVPVSFPDEPPGLHNALLAHGYIRISGKSADFRSDEFKYPKTVKELCILLRADGFALKDDSVESLNGLLRGDDLAGRIPPYRKTDDENARYRRVSATQGLKADPWRTAWLNRNAIEIYYPGAAPDGDTQKIEDMRINPDKDLRFDRFARDLSREYSLPEIERIYETLLPPRDVFTWANLIYGAVYEQSNVFFYLDACTPFFKHDYRLASTDDFYRAYMVSEPEAMQWYEKDNYLSQPPSMLKISGCNYPKLQLFKNIYYVEGGGARGLLAMKAYSGDVLFTEFSKNSRDRILEDKEDPMFTADLLTREGVKVVTRSQAEKLLSGNDRVDLPIDVKRFSNNGIRLSLNNTTGRSLVLHYADAYHYKWRAYVNAKETEVLPSNLGFKAVIVPPGPADITFIYRPAAAVVTVYFLIFTGLTGVALIAYFIVTLPGNGAAPRGESLP